MTTASSDLLLLSGTVTTILYRNEENGYTILRLDTQAVEDEVTVVGAMPGVHPGEGLTIHGRWIYHNTYGPQFKAELVEQQLPAGEKALRDYLASGAVKGIGPSTAQRLVDAFGEDVLSVIEHDPQRLTQLKGISPRRAESIRTALRAQLSTRQLLTFLSAHDLPLHLAAALYRTYGDSAIQIIEGNPYLLMEEPYLVSFPVVDRLAMEMEFGQNDPLRLGAALIYAMQYNLDGGHVFLPLGKLLYATQGVLEADVTCLTHAMDQLVASGRVVRETIAGEDACYLSRLYHCETYVSQRLLAMEGGELCPPEDLEEILAHIQTQQGLTYAPLQKEAVRTAARQPVMLLTGGPGTGKTTSLRGILSLFDHLGLRTLLTAPTGRAAKRLAETCGTEASTIHRLLETRYQSTSGQLTFSHDEKNPLEADAVILDEASMVDIILMQALMAALPNGCRLVLVGDPHQLPSVGPGNLLSDLIRSKKIPTLCLTEIFRQAATSAIIRNARAVDEGTVPLLHNDPAEDFFFLRRTDPTLAAETIVELCRHRLPTHMGIPAEQIQVLSPTRKGVSGTAHLNQMLQAALNPPHPDKAERAYGSLLYRVGDRVMQVKNNYDAVWESDSGSGLGIFNGDIGQVEAIEVNSGLLTVNFDGHRTTYSPDMVSQLEPAWAITVHKAQGSEYRAVILSVTEAAPMLLTRGILYTAMTRAKELLILVGDDRVITQMTKNDRQMRRYSGLRARLARG